MPEATAPPPPSEAPAVWVVSLGGGTYQVGDLTYTLDDPEALLAAVQAAGAGRVLLRVKPTDTTDSIVAVVDALQAGGFKPLITVENSPAPP